MPKSDALSDVLFAGTGGQPAQLAKIIIKFINNLAGTFNDDLIVCGRTKVVFRLNATCLSRRG